MGIVHVFVNESSHSSWTKFFTEFGSTEKYELRGNSEFVQYHTEIGIGTFWRDSWCEYDLKYISLTSGQVDKSKSTYLLGFCSMPREDVWALRRNWKMGRSSGRIFKRPLLVESYWESMEKHLNSSGISSHFVRHCRFFRSSRIVYRSGTLNLRNSQIGSSSWQCSTILIGQEKETMRFAFRIQKKSRRARRNSRRDIGRSSVLETRRSGMESAHAILKESGKPQLHGWNSNSRKQVTHHLQVPVSWVEEFWECWKGKATIHFNADASNTEILFRIIHSVNQLSIYGVVSNWCWQFGLRADEKGQEKILEKGEPVNKEVLKSVNSQDVNSSVSSPRLASGNRLRENIQDFESLS